MKRELIPTRGFTRGAKRYAKIAPGARANLRATLDLLETDAFDPRLKTHKLKGDLKGIWACSAGYDVRILFEFVQYEGSEAIILHSVGSHDEVY